MEFHLLRWKEEKLRNKENKAQRILCNNLLTTKKYQLMLQSNYVKIIHKIVPKKVKRATYQFFLILERLGYGEYDLKQETGPIRMFDFEF